jgi:hypothetical protein
MLQMLIPIAAMSASHSFPEKETLCALYTARPRKVSHAIHRSARCHQVMRRSTFLLASVGPRARRLPSLSACYAKIVASPIATDATSSKLVMCGPLLETGRAMVIA